MATSIDQLVFELAANFARFHSDLDKARDKVKQTTSDIGRSFSKISEITLGVSFARGLEGLALSARDAVTEMAKLGLEAKVQEDAFGRLAESVGASGDALAEALKRASGDIINTSDVMLAAARGLREGFAPEQLVKLMEVARQQSKLMGVDVVTAFNAVTEAIANQQTRALKNMGVVIDADQVMKDYAATLGVSADQLTNVGRAQAIYNKVIELTAQSTKALTTTQLTQSEVIQRLAGQWKQLREDLGKVLVDKGLAVLDWAQSLAFEIGANLPHQLTAMNKIWAATWKSATTALEPVAGMLQHTLIPALKGAAVVATAFGVGLTAAFTVIAGPIAYLGSILDDLSKNKWPDHKRATLEANVAVADARVTLAEAVKAFEELQKVQPGVAEGAEQVAKSLGKLGTNTLGGNLTDTTKGLTGALDGLNKAMRQLAERAASGVMGELDAEIESIANGVIEAARATKGMTPDVLKGLEAWARGLARIIALNKETEAAAKEVAEVVAASIDRGGSRDLLDEAEAWSKVAKAMHDVSVIADVTGDKTGGVADKIKILEGVLAEVITRFGAGSAEADKFRERLQELKNTADEFATLGELDFEVPTGVTRDLVDEAKIWSDLSANIRRAQREYLAVGDAAGAASAGMNQMAAAIADAIDRFGEGSEQVAALRDRFRELRDDFHAAEFKESLRVVDNQAQALGLTFDSLGAKIQAYRSTLARMAADPDPNWEAINGIRARMEALEDLKVATDLVTMAASRASDEFVEWAFTGKANFAEMAQSIVKDITKIILRLLILKAVEMATRAFGGGVGGPEQLSGPGVTVPAGATGGVVKHRPGGRLIIAGEKDDEVIIPLDRMGAIGSGGGDVQITIINNTPDEVSHKSEQAPDGRRIETFIISTVNRGLENGSFDKAMGIFGNKRQPVAR
ncbi:MAG TPA: phage tail tape measure C-terminal domain-containing protein [Kofleriaceae bacterium]|nr:phage tail tape measure C-terminal domain-containing protein [Kofleriaceae bacterium]